MGSASTPPPPVNNPGKDLTKYITGLQGAMPQLLGIEGDSRPKFGAMNLADIQQMLSGTSSQAGVLGIGSQASQASQAQLEQARSGEFANMLGNAGMVNQVLGAASPGSQQLAQAQTGMALDRYSAAQSLNPQEKRMADQTAREAFSARGRLNDNASVAAEVLGREDVLQRKREEASALGGQAFAQEQKFSDPALGMLSGSPASVLLGQDYLSRGSSAVGANMPQLIDTGAGISLGQQNASNLANWQSNTASAKNAQKASNVQTGAAVAGAAVSAYASYAGLLALSDKRLKKDIKKVGKTDSGLPIYTYKMKGGEKTHMGVMAQELEKKTPSAVHVLGGLKMVDYSKVK